MTDLPSRVTSFGPSSEVLEDILDCPAFFFVRAGRPAGLGPRQLLGARQLLARSGLSPFLPFPFPFSCGGVTVRTHEIQVPRAQFGHCDLSDEAPAAGQSNADVSPAARAVRPAPATFTPTAVFRHGKRVQVPDPGSCETCQEAAGQ